MAADALDCVVALYWKPVYRFIRFKFLKSNEDAKDLTQSFFASALQRDLFVHFDPARGSFRNYLRMAVERFSANHHAASNCQKRGGGLDIDALDETRVATALTVESPEDIFEREWQRQLFTLAIEDLRRYCAANGREVQFSVFEAYDLADLSRPTYAEIASRHGIAETSVTNHLAWARRTLRSFVTDRLRVVTSGERELREEMRRLWN